MAGLVPAISLSDARPCSTKRDARHKAGHDEREFVPYYKIANSVFFRSVTSMLPG
jgi:hypothetical protein